MAIGISNKWPAPPSGFFTTKGVIDYGQQLVEKGEIKHPIPQPQVLLGFLNATPKRKRAMGFPSLDGEHPVSKRNLRRGPGPRGGRYEWPEPLAREILCWYSTRLEGITHGNHDSGNAGGNS